MFIFLSVRPSVRPLVSPQPPTGALSVLGSVNPSKAPGRESKVPSTHPPTRPPARPPVFPLDGGASTLEEPPEGFAAAHRRPLQETKCEGHALICRLTFSPQFNFMHGGHILTTTLANPGSTKVLFPSGSVERRGNTSHPGEGR